MQMLRMLTLLTDIAVKLRPYQLLADQDSAQHTEVRLAAG